MEKLTISVEELGKHLGIGRVNAYRLVKQPGFPAFALGKRIIVPVAELERWLAEQAANAPESR